MSERVHIAIDVGASSGRVMQVRIGGGPPVIEEVHRFDNQPIRLGPDAGDRWSWALDALVREVTDGLGRVEATVDSIGIDTWGCDYGLVDATGALVAPITAYRDDRHHAAFESVRERLGEAHLYTATGTQFQPFNTLYQLATDAAAPDRPLERADRLLMIPDLLANRLCGSTCCERTNASTTQCFDSDADRWHEDLLRSVGVPPDLMPSVVAGASPEPLGLLRPEISAATGLPGSVPLLATATHDTASAVAAAPLRSKTDAYISSGTWSLVGVELDQVLASDAARRCNFTNEAGVFGTTRFLRNVSGLWLLQQCQSTWRAAGRDLDWSALVAAAEQSPAFESIIDPDHPDLAAPGDMPERLRARCRLTGEPVPADDAAIVRCIIDSLALRYAACLEELEGVTGRVIERLVVVGGGSRNGLLNRLTSEVTGRPVVVGSAEATALGNALVQHAALEGMRSIDELRTLVKAEHHLEPAGDTLDRERIDAARSRFRRITATIVQPLPEETQ